MALTLSISTPLTDTEGAALIVIAALLAPGAVNAMENIDFESLTSGTVVSHTVPAPLAPAVGAPDASTTEAGVGAVVPGQVDANGLPWDERIHSSNKKQNADGTWQKRRGITDITFDQVAAELRGATAETVFAATEVPPPPPPSGEIPPPPSAPAPTPEATAGGEWDGQPGFLKVMKIVTAKKLPADRQNALLEQCGLKPSLTSLLKDETGAFVAGDIREMFAALVEAE